MAEPSETEERRAFEALLEAGPETRDTLLDDLAPALADRVRRLLAAHESEGLDTPRTPDPALAPSEEPSHVGPYRLVERRGEGGMGVVYLAEQESPVRRRVALKLIKPGMDSRELVARFHAERQAQALMSHPGIARVFDAGATEGGRPYFVMEYVDGVPLPDYCDTERLSIDQRLDLFEVVCEAVQHAHQKGVIHRDLKPSNILVTTEDGRPQPKVIDFGVAKATDRPLGDLTVETRLGGFVGTPDYASPEQARAGTSAVDTRSDVYSLGTVLYELLTGLRPFDLRSASLSDVQDVLLHRDPARPSVRVIEGGRAAQGRAARRKTDPDGLRRRLRGDLDWIVMKALEKEPARRYATASELAADLRRHRAHQPVTASPPSRTYRFGRFVARHRGLLAIGALGVVALIAGIIGTSIGLVRASREAERATQQAAIAAEVIAFMNDDLLGAVSPAREGIEVTVREVVDRASEEIQGRFSNQPLVEASLRDTLAQTYVGLGELEPAERHLERLIEIRSEARGPDHHDTVAARRRLANVYRSQARHEDSEKLLRSVLETQRQSLGDAHPETLETLESLGVMLQTARRHAEAEAVFLEAEEGWENAGSEPPNDLLQHMSILYQHMGRLDEAEARQMQVLRALRASREAEDPDVLNAEINLVSLYLFQQEWDAAERVGVPNLERLRRVMGPEHPRTLIASNNLGYLFERLGRYSEAEELLLEVLATKERTLGAEHPSSQQTRTNLIRLYGTAGEQDKRNGMTEQTLALRRRIVASPTATAASHRDFVRLVQGIDAPRREDLELAMRSAEEAVRMTGGEDADLLQVLAAVAFQVGDVERAIGATEQALTALVSGQEPLRDRLELDLARYRAAAGKSG